MTFIKPHFKLNKKQRNGAFYFLLAILLLQTLLHYISVPSTVVIHDKELIAFTNQVDSLNALKREKSRIKRFNPNYLTDERGYLLGMSLAEIDRLFAYRNANKWINSASDFQRVTQVSDSLMKLFVPLFIFPEKKYYTAPRKNKVKVLVKKDVNLATSQDFQRIHGVEEKLANRIVNYRKLLGGFSYNNQLDEVWGMSKRTADNLKNNFKIYTLPVIHKIDINTASFKEVLSIVYLDYKTTKMLFNYRDSVGKIANLKEIKKIPEFPVDKYDRIALYLRAK